MCRQVGKDTMKVSGCILRSFYESGVILLLEILSGFLLFLLQNIDSLPWLAGPTGRLPDSLLCRHIGRFLSP